MQSLESWDCIIVDDGSCDGTRSLAESFSRRDRRIRVVTKRNGGTPAARNHGLALLSPDSEYVAIMDHDDVWTPDALETLVNAVESFPGAIGAHGRANCVNEKSEPHRDSDYDRGNGRLVCGRFGNVRTLRLSEPTSFGSLWLSNPYPPGLIVTKRTAFAKAGLFDEQLFPVDDRDMLLRLSRYGVFAFVNRVILSYRRHGANSSRRPYEADLRDFQVLQHKTFFSAENNSEQRRILRANWRATQIYHWRQKWRAAAKNLSKRCYLSAAREIAGTVIQICRFARGYPSRSGII